jgi:hypothetical protein
MDPAFGRDDPTFRRINAPFRRELPTPTGNAPDSEGHRCLSESDRSDETRGRCLQTRDRCPKMRERCLFLSGTSSFGRERRFKTPEASRSFCNWSLAKGRPSQRMRQATIGGSWRQARSKNLTDGIAPTRHFRASTLRSTMNHIGDAMSSNEDLDGQRARCVTQNVRKRPPRLLLSRLRQHH